MAARSPLRHSWRSIVPRLPRMSLNSRLSCLIRITTSLWPRTRVATASRATLASSDCRTLTRELVDELERVLDKAQDLLTALIEEHNAQSPVGGCQRLPDEQGCPGHDGQPQLSDGLPGAER